MKMKTIPDNVIGLILAIGNGIAAVYVGFVTFSRYPNVVQGIQALATLLLIYHLYSSPKSNVRDPVGIELEFPRVIKYILSDFFWYVIIVWSSHYLVYAIQYFLRTVIHTTW